MGGRLVSSAGASGLRQSRRLWFHSQRTVCTICSICTPFGVANAHAGFRCNNCVVHLKSGRDPICSVTSLPILLLVCTTIALPSVEDTLPCCSSVSHLAFTLSFAVDKITQSLAIIVAIECSWNVFPSTKISSLVLLIGNALLLLGIWFGPAFGRSIPATRKLE